MFFIVAEEGKDIGNFESYLRAEELEVEVPHLLEVV